MRALTVAVLSIWGPGVLGGQSRCEMRTPNGTLGLAMLECVTLGGCAVNEQDDMGWRHAFTVEPVVTELVPRGPAAGELAIGDVLVAIDGYLITTTEGGRRLANTPAGVPVILRIRRDGRERTVTLRAVPGCNEPRLRVREQGPGSQRVPRPGPNFSRETGH